MEQLRNKLRGKGWLAGTIVMALMIASHVLSIQASAKEPPFSSSVYLSSGYLHPIGISSDVGYTFGRYASVGLNVSIPNTFWSDPLSVAGGYTLRLFEPFSDMEAARFFVSAHHLASFFPATKTFEYVGATAGCLVFLGDQLAVRPEIGWCYMERTEQLDPEFWIFSTTRTTYSNEFTASLSFEIYLARIGF